jgi:hypothetical protein
MMSKYSILYSSLIVLVLASGMYGSPLPAVPQNAALRKIHPDPDIQAAIERNARRGRSPAIVLASDLARRGE